MIVFSLSICTLFDASLSVCSSAQEKTIELKVYYVHRLPEEGDKRWQSFLECFHHKYLDIPGTVLTKKKFFLP